MASPSLANSSPDRNRSRRVSLLRRTPLPGLSARIPRPVAHASIPANTTVARHAVPEPPRTRTRPRFLAPLASALVLPGPLKPLHVRRCHGCQGPAPQDRHDTAPEIAGVDFPTGCLLGRLVGRAIRQIPLDEFGHSKVSLVPHDGRPMDPRLGSAGQARWRLLGGQHPNLAQRQLPRPAGRISVLHDPGAHTRWLRPQPKALEVGVPIKRVPLDGLQGVNESLRRFGQGSLREEPPQWIHLVGE